MEWGTLILGFVLGLVSSCLTLYVQRSWQRKDDAAYNKKVIRSLVLEIEEGLTRTKYMANLVDEGQASYGRIYTALWTSVNQRLAATLDNPEILALCHHIYYRFDLINFNCESGRPEGGGAFAVKYVSEIEGDLEKLKGFASARVSLVGCVKRTNCAPVG